MKTLGALAFGVVTSVGLCAAGVAVASYVSQQSEVSHFADSDQPPLWTSKPKVVDTAAQQLVRLPARLSSYAVADLERQKNNPPTRQVARFNMKNSDGSIVDYGTTTASVTDEPYSDEEALRADLQENQLADAHIAWCSERYRSYDVTTDSYRSFSGEIRNCESPVADTPSVTHVASNGDDAAPHAAADIGNGYTQAHYDWCGNRYRSYRAEDNSYQPYAGTRTQCQSPYMDGSMDMASN